MSLPSPRTSDTNGAGHHGTGGPDLRTVVSTKASEQDWREYEPAIRRQEAAFGYPAPLPTEPNKNGKPRLSAAFSEWLMGLEPGWITDTPGITRNEALKAAGNGVVPQQCEAAARRFLEDYSSAMNASSACDLGPCAAPRGHDGTCLEASGWAS